METLEAMTLDSEIQMTGAMACAGQGFDVATDLFGCLDPKKNGRLLGGVPFFSFRGSGFFGMETWVVLSKSIFCF